MTPADEEAFVRRHEFVRDDKKDERNWGSWKTRMAARYYRKLHKEYGIVDLSRWREGACGLRWRTEREVLAGVGETSCAAKQCRETRDLRSYELPFMYSDYGDDSQKCELVKVRVCADCGRKLVSLGGRKRETKRRRRRRDREDEATEGLV